MSGGGAGASGTTLDPTRITATPPGFGVETFDGQVDANALGDPLTQAGGHPYSASTSIDFNTIENPVFDALQPGLGSAWPVEPVKDVLVDLPPGFVGNTTGVARCTAGELANGSANTPRSLCPPASQVGTTAVRINAFEPFPSTFAHLPLFNMVPPPDVPARFGFNAFGTVVTLDAQLRSGSDYGLSINGLNVSEGLPIAGTSLTFWGVPSDPSHDSERACAGQAAPFDSGLGGFTCTSGAPPVAFLRNPTSCTAPGVGLRTTLRTDSWVNPGSFQEAHFDSHLPPGYPLPAQQWGALQGPTGCDKVPFTPSIEVHPTTSAPSSPTGLEVTLSIPQDAAPDAISQADLRKAVVTLPEGMTINPSIADGVSSCTPAQIELHGTSDPTCPESSKIGAVTVDTPLLEQPLTGAVYLAAQNANPFNTNFAMYLVVKGSGVIVKLPGRIDADPLTGRLTTTFDDQPQLPFRKLTLSLESGSRAPLVTPPTCGAKTVNSELTGWSGTTVTASNPFTVDCTPGLGAFAPSFTADVLSRRAGAFTPFTVRMARSDLDQPLSGLNVKTPPGLLGMLSSVPLCAEAQAAAGTCSSASQIGHSTESAGAGSNPVSLPVAGQPQNPVYLTGPYKGAPFGLSVVVPAIAGPFNLGTVVVRAAISVDSHSGQITIASDPLPSILQGVPLQVRSVNVTVDRPGFMFNPTSCEHMSVDGAISSTQGAAVAVASPFQAASCASLKFKPSFTASTSGKTSKARGASLDVKVSSGEGPANTTAPEANIAKVDVQLPVILPSRLTTLQKACTAAVFDANPAACPAASNVGSATAHTPVLPVALTGPAYLVSHGGAAFPDLVLVLQGDGVRIDLTGNTQIKGGITYSHFDTVPDAPISSFELKLPEGPFSALAANANLCRTTTTKTVRKRVTVRVHGRSVKRTRSVRSTVAAPLLMPTTITAQNGAVVRQATKIAVTGCAKTTKASRHAKTTKGRHGNGR
jgi:hypothetical protein